NGNENAVAGDEYTYTVTVENQGPSTILDGTTLYFQDVVSNGQDIVEITSNKGTVSTVGAAGEFELEVTTAVAPNETFTLTVEVDVSSDAPSTINNTIHIWANDPGTDLDNQTVRPPHRISMWTKIMVLTTVRSANRARTTMKMR